MKTPDYINLNRKRASEVDLKKILKEVREKNKEYRRAMIEATGKALADGFRCGPKL